MRFVQFLQNFDFAETCHISAEIPVGVSVLYFRYTARNTASGTHEAFS
jgi:hypothetical protein